MLSQFTKMMKAEGLPELVIRTFSSYYEALKKGEKGMIPNSAIRPPSTASLIRYEDLSAQDISRYLKKIAVIKLNGGLGTSMGLSRAKSLLPVKGSMTFLDIIVRHVLALRSGSGYEIQLMFMNSFATEEDTLKFLEKYPDLMKQELPATFVQNKYPRIKQESLRPLDCSEKAMNWNPPGHGDIYTVLSSTGLLEQMINKGYRYAFVSNSDNLGATVDPRIAAYMEEHKVPFIMEVCDRLEMDKKGGHLAEDLDGQLLLREVAQCPQEDIDSFQNIEKYQFFNTNNLWIDLQALDWHLITGGGMMLLPLIVNPKEVDGTKVFQIETAMGAAISSFSGAKALVVPRDRFAPVKTTNDLLAVWSDAYELNDQYQIQLRRGLYKSPYIELDKRYYNDLSAMQKRFPHIPSLAGCKELIVQGDITFGEEVICDGRVNISSSSPQTIRNKFYTGNIELD